MTWRIYAAAAALAVAAGGCATAPAPKRPAAGALPVVLAKFERRLGDGRLAVAANVKNASAAPEKAVVVCAFDGGGDPPPIPVSLMPGEVLTVHFEAANVAAAVATISVRP